MKKIFWVAAFGFVCIHLAGCSSWVVRTSEVRKPRLDQEISGNRGFIFGKPSAAAKEPVFKERKTYRIEIEVPQWKRKEKSAPQKLEPAASAPKEDNALWGNRGYIFGRSEKKEEVPVKKTPDSLYPGQVLVIPEAKQFKK